MSYKGSNSPLPEWSPIAPDKVLFQPFVLISAKKHMFNEMLLMNTHNICFHAVMRKTFTLCSFLYRAMRYN